MTDDTPDKCPNCGDKDIYRESVHNGIGMMYGPWGCSACGWSEDSEYDLSKGQSSFDEKGGMVDQYGNYYPPGNPIAKACFRAYQEEASTSGKPMEFRKRYEVSDY